MNHLQVFVHLRSSILNGACAQCEFLLPVILFNIPCLPLIHHVLL